MIPHKTAWLLAGLLGLQSLAFGNASDTFTTDNGGWTHIGDSTTPPTFNATGGNPGGYISIADLAQGAGDYFVAPAKYLGNDSADYSGTLSFDLLLSDTTTGVPDDVILSNGTTTLTYVYPTQPTSGSWQHESLLLNPNDPNWYLTSVTTGTHPTQANFLAVLSSLTQLNILADYHSGTETVGLDNVSFVPEPASLALLSCAGLLVFGCRRAW